MAGRLGILVNSNRHPEYVLSLTRAARLRDRQVWVHFTGPGLELAGGPLRESLKGLAHASRDRAGVAGSGPADLPIRSLSEFFRACDRTVVF